jgi:hypothetical protein
MRNISIFLSFIIMILVYSCDPCKNLDCVASNFYGQFRIVSAANGQDLLFGPHKIYNINQVRFYSFNGADTTYFESGTTKLSGTGYDSILYVHFFPNPDVAYMRLSNGDIDTLNITYQSRQTKCCGTIKEIKNFRFNNTVDSPGQGTQELKK